MGRRMHHERDKLTGRPSNDKCAPSGDLQDGRVGNPRFEGKQEAFREVPASLGPISASLLSEDFQARLKHSLEQFTRQQQELARVGKEEKKEQDWETAADPQSSKPYQSPVASMATMGPVGRELAQMIHASQQWQHFGDFSSHWQTEEDRTHPPAPWTPFQNNQAYQDYWRSPGHLMAQQWAQSQLNLSDSQGSRRPPVHPFWSTYGPHILPPVPPQTGDLDPASQQDLTRSIQMLQEAQRLSALASNQIQELYQNANGKKRKVMDSDSPNSDHLPEALPLSEGPTLQPLFHADPEQRCSLCGASSTPVWRRIQKQLVCNACGLKKRRSNKKLKDSEQAIAAKTLLEGAEIQNLPSAAETAA